MNIEITSKNFNVISNQIKNAIIQTPWCESLDGDKYMYFSDLVPLAILDRIPRRALYTKGEYWQWSKDVPDYGKWIKEPSNVNWVVYVPFINRQDLLIASLESAQQYVSNIVVIDQSNEAPLYEKYPLAGIFKTYENTPTFTQTQNWMWLDAWKRGYKRYGFMHNDSVVNPSAFEKMISMADYADIIKDKWSMVQTRYDILCLFNIEAVLDTGCWDESWPWYVSDIDYYNRFIWKGWNHLHAGNMGVIHYGSQTIKAQKKDKGSSHAWAEKHYEHKWGRHFVPRRGEIKSTWCRRRYTIPYDGKLPL